MTTPASELRLLPLAALSLSTTQAQIERRAHLAKSELADLAENFKTAGVLQSILVRPFRAGHVHGACYEVVAGERRVLAARMAKLTEIPATVHAQQTGISLTVMSGHSGLTQDIDPIRPVPTLRSGKAVSC